MNRLWKVVLIFIIILAAFLRLNSISSFTEFRGDQGRAGLVALHSIQTGSLPLAGPTTLQNQHLGPFFYYLAIIVFGVSQYNMVFPSIVTAVCGIASIYILFLILKKYISIPAYLATCFIIAISPELITQDRIFWEPNFIPFFSILFVWNCTKILETSRHRYWLVLGILTSILFQLHYFNIIFLGIAGGLFFYKLLQASSDKKQIITSGVLGIIFFIIPLLPFIVYEMQHQWQDIAQIGSIIFSHTTSTATGKKLIVLDALDFGSRIIGYFIPFQITEFVQIRTIILILSSIILIIFPLKKYSQNKKILFAGSLLWLTGGMLGMGLYRTVIYNHYLLFLIPPVLILLAFLFESIQKIHWILLVIFVGLITTYQSNRIRAIKPTNDIARIASLGTLSLAKANHHPFALSLYPSNSFSDLHYRFFFETRGYTPVDIQNPEAEYIFILCDTTVHCSFTMTEPVQILCNEEHCSGDYGTLNLNIWRLKETGKTPEGVMFMYERK